MNPSKPPGAPPGAPPAAPERPSQEPRRPSLLGQAPQRPSAAPQAPAGSAPPPASLTPARPSAAPERASAAPERMSAAPRGRSSAPGEEGEVRLGSSERTRAAGDAMRSLARASRSYLIYDAGNQAVRGFIEEVRGCFERYFNAHGDMELTVRPYELLLDGEAVYLERDRERSLSLKLFRDGVRKLTLTRSADWGELTRLLEILSIRFVGVRLNEDDVVTLLWKAGFANIRIEAVEGFVPDDDDEVQGSGVGARTAEKLFGRDSSRVGDVASTRVPDDFDLPAPRLPAPLPVHYKELAEWDTEALRAEVDSPRLPEATLTLVRELLDVALEPTDPLAFEEAEGVVREVRDFLLAEDRLDMLLNLFDELTRFRERAPADAARVDALLAGFVDAAAVRKLIRSVSKDAAEPPERLQQILGRVPGDVLKLFFELLEAERDDHSRRVLRHLIAQQLPARTLAVVERFRASSGPVAADLLRVLAVAVPDAATQILTSLMQGSDTEVQHEFLRLSADLTASANLRALLAMMLQAPALDVREHALEVIAARGERGAFPTLQRYAEGRADQGAAPAELAAAGRAMARLDGDRAFELFREWALPKGFFNKLFNLRPLILRGHVAVWGLSVIPAPEAAAVLQQVYTKGEVELRDAAREAMAAAKAGRAP
ncbi:MAG: hypothetical protein U0324_23025 [Polyangiales bacterium]